MVNAPISLESGQSGLIRSFFTKTQSNLDAANQTDSCLRNEKLFTVSVRVKEHVATETLINAGYTQRKANYLLS